MTVWEAVEAAFEAPKGDLKGNCEVGRWMSPMRTLILPKLGSRKIAGLTPYDIVHTLQPVWHERAPTPRRRPSSDWESPSGMQRLAGSMSMWHPRESKDRARLGD